MQIRPKILLDYGRINQPIQVPLSDLLLNPTYQSFLVVDSDSGSGSITVKNLTGFAINQILLIGEPGNQNSEIIKTHSSTAPTSGVITLASNTVNPHGVGTKVYVINYDDVRFFHASTASGSQTQFADRSIVANNDTTNVDDTSHSSGFYFAKFYNTITGSLSSVSDAAPYNGYTIFSARSIIDNALGMINKKTSSVLTDEYAFMQIDNCQMECLREYKRWSFMQEFNYVLGQSYEGQLRVALPADCDDQQTTKSVYNFRIGKQDGMIWIDKEEWDAMMTTIAYTTLATSISLGATSIVLTNSGDFNDTGTVKIGANSYTYSANNKSTNTLTITASATTNTAGEDATEFGNFGQPTWYTVWDGFLYFFPGIGSSFAELNLYLDYYKSLTQIQADYDNIVLPDPTVVQYYVAWKFMLRLNNGEETDASKEMKQNYLDRREQMKKKEWFNRKFIWKPE